MKALRLTSALVCLMLGSNAFSQAKPDSLGLPGDNFDLYGALELFKKADTPEAFEKAINSNDNEVNNLDLDGDGKVDYVKVIDKKDGDAHTLVLQVDVSETEKQDVAVIEVEKTGDDKAHVQIVGDEELYGKDYIIEPKDETADKNPNAKTNTSQGNGGSNDDVYSNSDNSNREPTTTNNNTTNNYYNNSPNPPVVVNVWGWPSVQYIYGPSYAVWISPWYWRTYPVWWDPWAPVYWRYHYRRAWHYHYPYYHRVNYYRSPRVHNWYYGRRTSSQTVRNHRESGFYGQKQMIYKNNTPRGQKYNNRPARDKQDFQKQNLQQPQKTGGVRNQNQNPVKMQNQPEKQHGVQQKPDKGQMQQQQPVKQQPVKQQPMQQQPRQNIQPKQEMPKQQMQPKQQVQPKQQMQQQPRQHTQQQSMPKQQMHSPGGGGGHGQRSGGGGRPR